MNAGHCPHLAATLWCLNDPSLLGEQGRVWDLGFHGMSQPLFSESRVRVMP